MRSSLRFAAAAFAAAVALGACGGDDDGGSPLVRGDDDEISIGDDGGLGDGDLPDPCELVTEDDAAGLFEAVAVEADDEAPINVGASCIWENVGGDELGTASHLLQVHAFDGDQFYGAEIYEDEDEIDGLGDRAFVAAQEGIGGVTVQWVQDGKVFSIDYSIINIGVEGETVEATSRTDAVVELARRASDRV